MRRLYCLEGLQVRMRVRRRKRLSLHRGPAPVPEALTRVAQSRALPLSIGVDRGTECTSKALEEWDWKNGVQLDFVRSGIPTENGMTESFNGRLRDECVNSNEFESLADARTRIEAWRIDYSHQCPHGALNNLTPCDYDDLSQSAELRSG